MKQSIQRKHTFWQRFKREAVWWGIPMVCVELIGIPMVGWGWVLIIVVPATLVGVLAITTREHLLISALAMRNQP